MSVKLKQLWDQNELSIDEFWNNNLISVVRSQISSEILLISNFKESKLIY